MTRPLSRLALACLLCMTLVLPVAAQQQRVWVVLAEEGGVYAEAAAVLRAELEPNAALSIVATTSVLDVGAPPPALIVTVGTLAYERTLRWLEQRDAVWQRVPVLATLLPRAAYEAQQAVGGTHLRVVSAVVLDQPLGRQMALIQRALPERRRVAVLPGPQTRPQLGALEQEARARGIQLVAAASIDAPEQIYPSLKEATASADVLLALPDALIYNSASLQNILLASYRARVPLVAFSAAYVKAGALLAVYSTPAQVARHAGGLARGWLAGRGLPPAQSPREFAVVANNRVATSLGIQLDDAALIAEDLRRAEGQ
jgi:putative ABC transport system substrate-binding protein